MTTTAETAIVAARCVGVVESALFGTADRILEQVHTAPGLTLLLFFQSSRAWVTNSSDFSRQSFS